MVAAAAGGPKGLILGPLDRFIFGQWLASTRHEVHLVGASIGAWRSATACLSDPEQAFERFEHDYVHQHYGLPEGQRRLRAQDVGRQFGQSLKDFFGGREDELLKHPRYRLHVVTSQGRGLLRREAAIRTAVGYAGAFACNLVARRALGLWLDRVVFSAPGAALPFDAGDFPTRNVPLSRANLLDALQASCSIPFVLSAVHDIEGTPRGAHWDGGITDYHLHLNYAARASGLVLYPHFQKAVVAGWLDKGLPWRHSATPFLDTTVLLTPDPQWVASLPLGKLPDRTDFAHYGDDLPSRVKAWQRAIGAARQLSDEFQNWLHLLQTGHARDIEALV